MKRREILEWLREQDPERLQQLWKRADEVRRESVGDAVHLRGLIEFGNHCARTCAYCGLRAHNTGLERYRMNAEEILECARAAADYGYGTVVLQSGEDYGYSAEWMEDIVRRIKDETALAVTLSLGERPDEDLARWRRAGADRYLLRFETSDPDLYEAIHPPLREQPSDRISILCRLRKMGYEVGSGVMIGIPGQTWQTLADDIELFRELDLDMVGVGPFIAHPDTPLGRCAEDLAAPPDQQVPGDELTTYKVVALTRITCPLTNLPSTTALATINLAEGRELGLQRGANVVMPNVTPAKYRALYEIYPSKACINETAEQCHGCMRRRIESVGRTVGTGPGASPNWLARHEQVASAS
jgi:biotin synthase